LDRLSQFFIAPLLLKSGVERELKAIESEYQLNKQSDHARLQQLWSTTSDNPDHPFSQFGWGNIKSLKEIPEQENVDPMVRLRSFYDKVSCKNRGRHDGHQLSFVVLMKQLDRPVLLRFKYAPRGGGCLQL
jgi:hypothetical protein